MVTLPSFLAFAFGYLIGRCVARGIEVSGVLWGGLWYVGITMRVLGLDIGQARVGVAVSDPSGRVATPLEVLRPDEVLASSKPPSLGRRFRMLLEDWAPESLVVGLPLTLSGEEGPQAQAIRERAAQIGEASGLPIIFADERLSSVAAKRSLREMGATERTARGKVDMIAASLFLQAWLESASTRGNGSE